MTVNTLAELLRQSADAWPDQVALSEPGGSRTVRYADLDALASSVATELRSAGVGTGHVVAIVSDNCIEFAVSLFGVLAAGACAAPLSPALPAQELGERLRTLGADMTLMPTALQGAFAESRGSEFGVVTKLDVVPGSDGGFRANLSGVPHTLAAPDRLLLKDVALTLFTGGTTGTPNLVPLTHRNVLASIEGICETYELTPHDTTVLVMPLSHGHGLIAGLLATLRSGGVAHMPTGGRFHALSFWPDLAEAGATWYTAVPAMHEILLSRAADDSPHRGYPKLRFAWSCSAPLAPAVQQELERVFGVPVIAAYGMTEAAHQVSSNPLPGVGPDKAGSVGRPTGLEVRISASDGRACGPDGIGEIWLRGQAIMAGYVENAKATTDRFTGDWFHTGDIGRVDRDGYLFVTGRIKEMINRGGEKVAPAAVDAVLQSNPNVQDALAFGVPDPVYGEEVQAAVVLRPGRAIDEDALKEFSRSRLSAFEIPKRIHFVRDLPRTAKGSGDRRELATRFAPKH